LGVGSWGGKDCFESLVEGVGMVEAEGRREEGRGEPLEVQPGSYPLRPEISSEEKRTKPRSSKKSRKWERKSTSPSILRPFKVL